MFIKSKVWQWPNPTSVDGGWHFVILPKDSSYKDYIVEDVLGQVIGNK